MIAQRTRLKKRLESDYLTLNERELRLERYMAALTELLETQRYLEQGKRRYSHPHTTNYLPFKAVDVVVWARSIWRQKSEQTFRKF